MARPKGSPKLGGRKKGTPNKKTLMLQEIFDEVGLDIPRKIAELVLRPTIKDKDKAYILLELMSYLYPKRKAVDLDEEGQIVPEEKVVYVTRWGSSAETDDEN